MTATTSVVTTPTTTPTTTTPTATAPIATAAAVSTTRERRWTDVFKRWPTLLALVMSADALFGGGERGEVVEGFGEGLLILPLLYLVVAKLERRGATWPVFAIGTVSLTVLRLLDVVSPSVVFVGVAVAALVWSTFGKQVREPGFLKAEAWGTIGFVALGLAGLAVDAELGRYLLAAGWFLHGVWDLVHLRIDKVVAPSFAEWCAVIDIVIAIQLAFIV
jgi:hypothetical protein